VNMQRMLNKPMHRMSRNEIVRGSPIARIPLEKLSSFFQALRGRGSSQSRRP
jgi:hypothetical protein